MTLPAANTSIARPTSRPIVVATIAAAGCMLLALRPWILVPAHRGTYALLLFVALGGAGLAWPIARPAVPSRATTLAVAAFGLAAFAIGRIAGGGFSPLRASASVVALNSLAAVCEELFFRRFVYGVLEHRGPFIAVTLSALSFAVVHLTIYGGWAMPLDVAAGFVLSWQRYASGTWRVPLVTHVVANLLIVLP